MKRTINILILFAFLSLSGCWTKVYLGKEKEPEKILSDDAVMSSRAIDPTTVPAGGTWGTVRGILNSNFGSINGTLDSLEAYADTMGLDIDTLEVQTLEFIDSLAAHRTELDGKLNLADSLTMYVSPTQLSDSLAGFTGGGEAIDTTSLSARIDLKAPIANPTFTGIQKVSTTDTLATQAYARTYGGTGTVTIGDVRDEIADSLNILRPSTLIGDGTKGPFFDGSSDGGQMLYFYGDNGFYTALQGGAPTANRSYRLPIAELPPAGSTSLMNIDQYGNMGFVSEASKVSVADTTGTAVGSYVSGYTFQQGMINKVTASDSLDVYATPKQLSDSLTTRIAAGTSISTIAAMQVDSLTKWVTVSQLSDSLAAFTGGLSSGEVATQINDTIVARLAVVVPGVRLADSTGNASGNYVTNKKLVDYVTANAGSATGVTLNSGTLTLTGDLATADNITFYTNGDGQYDLPAGGGNLTIMSQVQGWISDSLDKAVRLVDTAAMLSPYALLTEVGSGGITASDTASMLSNYLTEDRARILDSDTIPLFIFGAGSGFSADTALFNNNRLAGAFYNSGSDTLYVTELRGVLVEGTGTETIAVQVSWDVNMKDGTPTNLNTSALTVTSMTTGTSDTTFDNNGIPPDTWVWCTLSGASSDNKPTMLILTMTGYKRNRSY